MKDRAILLKKLCLLYFYEAFSPIRMAGHIDINSLNLFYNF